MRTQSTYHHDEIGEIMHLENATVVSSRLVEVRGLNNKNSPGWGATVGAAVAGASAYGITETDSPAGVAITILAVIGGALAGQFIDEQSNSSLGVEYILTNSNGEKTAVVQTVNEAGEQISKGTNVVLLHGKTGYIRVVPE